MPLRLHLSIVPAVAVMTGFALMTRADAISIPPEEAVSSSSEIPGIDRLDDYLVDESGLFDGEHDVLPDGKRPTEPSDFAWRAAK
jgi:hypothetical protein